ncbi:MAG TPA: serine hydrolase domain-containing protein [Longimicrobium sp.]|nr:serine hydrolase domain-containing protein [Longimicrobium sp.]
MNPTYSGRLAGVLALAALLCGCATWDPPPPPSRLMTFAARVDSLVPLLLAESGVPGIAVGVMEGGQVIATRGYGLADRASGRPMTERTLLNFASVSKPVTAWGVLHLVDGGSISLDAPVGPALHRWRLPPSEFGNEGVTVRRLLSHAAGTSVISAPWFPADTTLPTLEQVLRGEAGGRGPVRVERQPGARWMYSGGGYAVLQLMVEEASRQSFAEYMRTAVFQPLGMHRTTFAPAAVSGGEVATGYDEEGNPVAPYRFVSTAAGGLYSSVEDFTRFLTFYAGSRHGVLHPRTFDAMLTPVADVNLEGIADGLDVAGERYALGHGIHRTRLGETIVYHSGGNPGYLAYFLVMPERGIGMVVAANGGGGVPVITRLLQLWSQHYGVDIQPIY